MNYFLAPRSGEKSYKNYVSTIRSGVDFHVIEPQLDENGKKILSSEDVIYAWGNRKGMSHAWNRMQNGDTVIFYANKRLIMSGQVYYKKHDPALALLLWPPDENGNPWEYVFFIKNLRYFNIPIEVFNKIVGYKSNYIVQGFTYLNPERIQKIEKEYTTVEKLFDTFTDAHSPEIPLKNEPMFVNVAHDIEPQIVFNPHITPKILILDENKKIKKAVKIDFLERNKKNAITGSKGEVLVEKEERKRLVKAGRSDLAKEVKRISTEDDSAGYDILSFETDGTIRYIEVKTSTRTTNEISFYLSANEYREALTLKNYYIAFVDRIDTHKPRITWLQDPLEVGKFSVNPSAYIVQGIRE